MTLFSVADGFKAGFYRGTCISSDGRPHHAFASHQMLYHLKFATRWYVDATFFLVDRPIVQLLSINGFVKNDQGKLKQVPLIFFTMTRRQASDYVSVFRFAMDLVKSCIPGDNTGPKLEEITSDFEWSLWIGIQKTFPGVAHHGCSFHWKQCILRKVGNLGLINDFKRPGPVQDSILRIMALVYLPANKIGDVFTHLQSKAPEQLTALFTYVYRNWISDNKWPPKNCQFYSAIRTNNDAEGLHFIWNDSAGRKMKFYKLADFMEELSDRVAIDIRLLTHAKLCKEVRKLSK